jgi:DNA primase
LTNFARRIVLAYDADAAGQAAADRFYEWERHYDVDIRVAALPAGADPADLARRDPDGLRRAIGEARPYLAFQIERLLGRADMATAEGRVRAATAALELIAAHPNELVRDQYLMEVADRCRVDPGRLRSLARPAAGRPRPAGPVRGASVGADHVDRPQPVAVNGAELEALRLAVHRPADLADRLQGPLFAHPLARGAFSALAAAPTLHDAIAGADPQTADLLQRLAVEEADADPDDVLTRLVERAGHRGLDELQVEARHADDPAVYVPTITWLKHALETLRSGEEGDRNAAQTAHQHLVDWIVARSEAEDQQHRGADPDGCG